MENPIIIALIIAGIGMTLLFLSLALFYGLLLLLTRLFPERKKAGMPDMTGTVQANEGVGAAGSTKLRAAAIAVALARAEAEKEQAASDRAIGRKKADTSDVSPWWRLHHQRQMGPDAPHRRSP